MQAKRNSSGKRGALSSTQGYFFSKPARQPTRSGGIMTGFAGREKRRWSCLSAMGVMKKGTIFYCQEKVMTFTDNWYTFESSLKFYLIILITVSTFALISQFSIFGIFFQMLLFCIVSLQSFSWYQAVSNGIVLCTSSLLQRKKCVAWDVWSDLIAPTTFGRSLAKEEEEQPLSLCLFSSSLLQERAAASLYEFFGHGGIHYFHLSMRQ